MGDKINKICYHVMDDESKCSSIDLTVASQKKNKGKGNMSCCLQDLDQIYSRILTLYISVISVISVTSDKRSITLSNQTLS